MKKLFMISLKIISVIVMAIGLLLAFRFIANLISKRLEQRKIESYGQFVTVDGKNMNVVIEGGINGRITTGLCNGIT